MKGGGLANASAMPDGTFRTRAKRMLDLLAGDRDLQALMEREIAGWFAAYPSEPRTRHSEHLIAICVYDRIRDSAQRILTGRNAKNTSEKPL